MWLVEKPAPSWRHHDGIVASAICQQLERLLCVSYPVQDTATASVYCSGSGGGPSNARALEQHCIGKSQPFCLRDCLESVKFVSCFASNELALQSLDIAYYFRKDYLVDPCLLQQVI